MKNEYEFPKIEIIKFDYEIKTNSGSIVVNYPWIDDDENIFIE